MLLLNTFLICLSVTSSIFLLRLFLHRKWADWVDDRIHLHQQFKVPELNDSTHQENRFYRRVLLYVNSLPSLLDADLTNLLSGKGRNDIVLSSSGDDQVIHDTFLGARLLWVNRIERSDDVRVVSRVFVLRIKRKDKQRILKPYLQHIHTVSDEIERRRRELRIHSNCGGKWKSVPFNHPATFDSLVIDPDLKSKIQLELETFLRSRRYYQKLGRVWKRSYLLYGDSGTGKSSFVAAVANFIKYDVYDVNLSQVHDDADLNSILMQCSRKSLIVVEDLDRFVSEKSRTSPVTQSGLLNFMDGVSNFHDERIMIFTMTNKDGVDPALLRPGRIDVHIYFPMCNFQSFKGLASNYLGVKVHKLFPLVEEIFQSGATMSPAEISELMLVNRSSPSRALKSVIAALQSSGRRGKVAPLSNDRAESSPAPPHVAVNGGGAAVWKEITLLPKKFRKLCGLLRLKSGKKPTPLDQDYEIFKR